MNETEPVNLVRLLQRPILRIRTGVVLLPLAMLGRERDLAAQVAIEAVDWRQWKLNHLSSDSSHLGLSTETVLRDLGRIVDDVDVAGGCLWIYNADLALSGLRYDERLRLWAFLYSTFKQGQGLLLSLPAGAFNLLPTGARIAWERDERLARWEGA